MEGEESEKDGGDSMITGVTQSSLILVPDLSHSMELKIQVF